MQSQWVVASESCALMLAIRKVVELPYHETRRTLISGVAGESFVISLVTGAGKRVSRLHTESLQPFYLLRKQQTFSVSALPISICPKCLGPQIIGGSSDSDAANPQGRTDRSNKVAVAAGGAP